MSFFSARPEPSIYSPPPPPSPMPVPFRPPSGHCELIDLGEPQHALQSVRMWPSESVHEELQVTISVYHGQAYEPRPIYIYNGPLTKNLPVGPTDLPFYPERYATRFLRIETRGADGASGDTPRWALIRVRQALLPADEDDLPTHSRTVHFIPQGAANSPLKPSGHQQHTKAAPSSTARHWLSSLLLLTDRTRPGLAPTRTGSP